MNLSFQYPEALWLLLLIPVFIVVFVLNLLWKKRKRKLLGDPLLVNELLAGHSQPKSVIKFLLITLAFGCGCLALANPRKPDPDSTDARRGIDIVLAIDISNSMKATDVAPSRLAKAKQFVSKLIDRLQDDRVGLVVFAGNAYAQMPLTFDREASRMYVATSTPEQITAQGTNLSEAFEKADFIFGKEDERFRSVILITDGETHDDNALEKLKELAAKGIMVNTVGLGSAEGSRIVDSLGNAKKDVNGQVVISKLNEDILKNIAAATNGRYIHLGNTNEAVAGILEQFSQIEKKALGDTSLYNYSSFYYWLAVPMLLLMAIEIFFPDKKHRRL